MNALIAAGTFSCCVLISIILYKYRAFITQIFIISVLSVFLWSMSMLAYALNNKHNIWSMFESQTFTIFENLLDLLKTRAQQAPDL